MCVCFSKITSIWLKPVISEQSGYTSPLYIVGTGLNCLRYNNVHIVLHVILQFHVIKLWVHRYAACTCWCWVHWIVLLAFLVHWVISCICSMVCLFGLPWVPQRVKSDRNNVPRYATTVWLHSCWDLILSSSCRGAGVAYTQSVYGNLSSHESGAKANCWCEKYCLKGGANTFMERGVSEFNWKIPRIGVVVEKSHALLGALLFRCPNWQTNDRMIKWILYEWCWSQLSPFAKKPCYSCIHWTG